MKKRIPGNIYRFLWGFTIILFACTEIESSGVVDSTIQASATFTTTTTTTNSTPLPTEVPEVTLETSMLTETPLSPTKTPFSTLPKYVTKTPISTNTPAVPITVEVLADWWSLQPGNYWVSHSINTDFGLTATYIMTDTVQEVRVDLENYYVKMNREAQFVSGDESVMFSNSVKLGDYWFIIGIEDDHVKVYRQNSLNLPSLDSAVLEYVFPLEIENCWSSDPSTESLFDCNIEVSESEIIVETAIESFEDCYALRKFTNVGSGNSIFCPGVGIVKKDFGLYGDSEGYSASYDETLIDYSIQE